MKKNLLLVLLLVFVLSIVGCSKPNQVEKTTTTTITEDVTKVEEPKSNEPKSVGFVMVGLNNAFFESLQKEFTARFTRMGWEVDVANGEFNPQTQITAMENFIAMKKDAIVLWAVSPEPLNAVTQQAMDAGIKVLAFVQPLDNFDASMIAENTKLATSEAMLAADWIEKNFPDAEDQSVPVALITRDNVDSTKQQGDVLREIEKYTSKAKLVKLFDSDEEAVEAGMHAAETIYTMNPEIKVFLTVNSAVALGVNNYFTAMSSPVTDYTDMGIFTINGSSEIVEQIILSKTDEAPLRGTIMTGNVALTVTDMVEITEGMLSGKYKDKYLREARNLFIYGDTVDEFVKTEDVTSVTEADFYKK